MRHFLAALTYLWWEKLAGLGLVFLMAWWESRRSRKP